MTHRQQLLEQLVKGAQDEKRSVVHLYIGVTVPLQPLLIFSTETFSASYLNNVLDVV